MSPGLMANPSHPLLCPQVPHPLWLLCLGLSSHLSVESAALCFPISGLSWLQPLPYTAAGFVSLKFTSLPTSVPWHSGPIPTQLPHFCSVHTPGPDCAVMLGTAYPTLSVFLVGQIPIYTSTALPVPRPLWSFP